MPNVYRKEPFVCSNIDCDSEGEKFPNNFDYCPHCGEMLKPEQDVEEEEIDDPA